MSTIERSFISHFINSWLRARSICVLTSALAIGSSAFAAGVNFAKEPACDSLLPVSQGGPAPRDPNLVVLRWLSGGNEEVAYRSNVILIDAWYDHAPSARPLGFDRTAVKKATAILIDHAHPDHFADVPYVAQLTGAPVVGAPISIETAQKFGIPATQTRVVTGKGGELLRYDGLTIEPVLTVHNDDTPELHAIATTGGKARQELLAAAGTPMPANQMKDMLGLPGTMDPRVMTEGVIGYLLTFANGYTIYYLDSTGTPNKYQRALASRIGSVDIGIFAYSNPVPDLGIKMTMPMIRLFKPHIFIPVHHDDIGGTRFETPVEPLAMAIRDEVPAVRTISPLYRTPVCIDIRTKQVSVGP